MCSVPSSSATNQLHIKQQILRRKKLVAQSKLAKQLRPHQHSQKSNDQNSANEGQVQGFPKPHGQNSFSSPNNTPNQSPQAGTPKLVNASKQQLPASSTPTTTQPSSIANKEITKPDKAASLALQKQNLPKQSSLSAGTAEKQETQQLQQHHYHHHHHVSSSDHMHPPNYHHVSGTCHETTEEVTGKLLKCSSGFHFGMRIVDKL